MDDQSGPSTKLPLITSFLIRQNGTKFKPGENVGLGRDYTIYAMIQGKVVFEQYSRTQKQISVYAVEAAQ